MRPGLGLHLELMNIRAADRLGNYSQADKCIIRFGPIKGFVDNNKNMEKCCLIIL